MGGVEFGNSPADASKPCLPGIIVECTTVGQRRRKAGKQNKELRGITEPEVPQGQLRQHVAWHMVDKNEDEGQAAEKIDPEIPWWSEGGTIVGASYRSLERRDHVRVRPRCQPAASRARRPAPNRHD
jgi:hypothetical protein